MMARKIDALKITVERGNAHDGMKKAVVYCDSGALDNGGCKVFPNSDCGTTCCAFCKDLWDCEDACERIEKD